MRTLVCAAWVGMVCGLGATACGESEPRMLADPVTIAPAPTGDSGSTTAAPISGSDAMAPAATPGGLGGTAVPDAGAGPRPVDASTPTPATGSDGSAPATGGTGGLGDAGPAPVDAEAGTSPVSSGTLPPVTSVEKDGPFKVTVDKNAGANSWVFRPTDLGLDGVKHPIFVWGTGATSVPSQYMDHFTRVASHGFVVISPNNSFVDAASLKASLNWIVGEAAKQGSIYYQKLNTAKIAMGGHSLGSVGTFDVEAMETRLTTTIHIAGGSFDGMGSSKVKTPTAYMCGQMDLDLASPQCLTDFQNVKTQPTFFVQLKGINHIDAARSALPAMVAWLRWWLAGETERKSMFVGSGCDFCKGIWDTAKTKNF